MSNDIPVGELAMVTLTFGPEEIGYYVNGEAKTFSSFSGGDVAGLDSYQAAYKNAASTLLGHMTTATEFYLGKGYWWWGTFPGKADKLGFYDKALTADEVKALYDSQKDAYANPIDLNAKEDVTAQYIVNADFGDTENPLNGWERTAEPERSDLGRPYYSAFQSANFGQEVHVPAGLYTISVQAHAGIGGRSRFYANSSIASVAVDLSTTFNWTADGNYVYETEAAQWENDKEKGRYFLNVMVGNDGQLVTGVDKYSPYNHAFLVFDNFRLEKASLNDMLTLYKDLRNSSTNLLQGELSEGLIGRLSKALAMVPSENSMEAYAEIYLDLKAVYDVCNRYIEFNAWKAANIANMTGFKDATIGEESAKKAFESALDVAENLANKSDITIEDINNVQTNVTDAFYAYVGTVTDFAEGVEQIDMTSWIVNPNFDANNANGWSGDSPKQYKVGTPEFWNAAFNFNQTIGNLPDGKYKVDVQARHFGTEGYLYATSGDITMQQQITANTISGTDLLNGNLTQEANSMIAERESGTDNSRIDVEIEVRNGNLTIGMGAANAGAWVVFDDFHLTLLEPYADIVTLNETEAYNVTADIYANVTLTRTLKSDGKWNTFCVPFDMTAEQLEANGITDVRTLESANVEGKSVTLNFSESNLNAVEAGVPYLVKVDASYDGTINVENVLVSAAEPTTVSVEGGVSMTGNYAAGNVPTGAYFISDNAFYYADVETVVLKGFRAYINVNGTSEAAGANRLMINLDGEVTGIEDVLGEEAAEADKLVNVVSLDGMTVKAGVKKSEALDGLQKGIYIVDGKKYVVK